MNVQAFSALTQLFLVPLETWKTKGTPHVKSKNFLFSWSMQLQLPATHRHNSNGYPKFSTITDLNMTTSISPDVADYRFKIAAKKAELEITFER